MTNATLTSMPAAAQATLMEGYSCAPVVLLVDDEANILSSLRRLLRPNGYTIHTATSGDEALATLSNEAVDLIVSDMRMPGMDGAQLLAKARAQWPDTIRILLTGHADVSSAMSAINEGGIYRYISKPWNDDDIQLIIRQALGLRGLSQEKKRLELLTREQNEELQALNASLEQKVFVRTGELQTANQELTLAHEKLKKSFFSTVQMLTNLIEIRAPHLAGHGRRVADVSRRIAERMGLAADITHDILLAGLLHDIGKIGHSDELLATPMSKMTGEELGISRKHTITGEATLMSLPDMKGVAQIIRSHHERWDGKGFPDNLVGDKIPLGARVLALANDYDAAQIGSLSMKKLTVDEAKQYVIEGRGFRYDPTVVEAFGELIGRAPTKKFIEKRLSGAEVQPGMVLARDLYSPDGILLLAVAHVMDEVLIKQLREYEKAFGKSFVVCVRVREEP